MKCDPKGVPSMIQELKYLKYGSSGPRFQVTLFNGQILHVEAIRFCSSISPLRRDLNRYQWLEAENNIERHFTSRWAEYFPQQTEKAMIA